MGANILGISPGTRTMGIAVIQNGDLIEWQVKTFKGRWSKEKLKLILRSIALLYEYHRVNGIAFKEASPLHSSKNLKVLNKYVIRLTRGKKVKFSIYTLSDLKRESATNIKHTKDDLMEFLTEKYPELRKQYLKERNNLTPYYLKMFEAVAAARILNRDMEAVK